MEDVLVQIVPPSCSSVPMNSIIKMVYLTNNYIMGDSGLPAAYMMIGLEHFKLKAQITWWIVV